MPHPHTHDRSTECHGRRENRSGRRRMGNLADSPTPDSLCYDVLVLLPLLSFNLWFSYRFWRAISAQPWASPDSWSSKLTRVSLKTCIVASNVLLVCATLGCLVCPLLQMLVSGFSLYICAARMCVARVTYVCAYTAYQRVLLERLKVTFATTKHPVSASVAFAFNAMHSFYLLCLSGIVILWTNPCSVQTHFYEMPNVHFRICHMRMSRIYWPFVTMAVALFTLIMATNVALVWMYVWRLKAVFMEANYRHALGRGLDSKSRSGSSVRSKQASIQVVMALALMRKSTVVTIWSATCSLLVMATWLLPFQTWLIAMDLVFNQVLLYCLFPFGDELYERMFGFCHPTVDRCLPDDALNVELEFAEEMMSATPLPPKCKRNRRKTDTAPQCAQSEEKETTITVFSSKGLTDIHLEAAV